MNWTPDSCDESDDSSTSEVRFVTDSLACETEVPDSQETFADVDQSDVADALLRMASTDVSIFKPVKVLHDKAKTMETYGRREY